MSLIKLALDPFTAAIGAFAGFNAIKSAGGRIFGMMAGANLHNAHNLMLQPKDSWMQRSVLADSVIALKKAAQNKVLATRKPLGLLAFSDPELHMKLMAANNINTIGRHIPQLDTLFDNNKLNVGRLKNILESSSDLKDSLRAGVGARSTSGAQRVYMRHRQEGMSEAESLLRATQFNQKLHNRLSEKVNPIMSHLDIGKNFHNTLSQNEGYGYKALERASSAAEKSMNRPNLINYSNHLYEDPIKNEQSTLGRFIARPLQGFVKQAPVVPQASVQNRTLDKLTAIAKKHNITDQPITPEHIKGVADQLPNMRQDLLAQSNSFLGKYKQKIFG